MNAPWRIALRSHNGPVSYEVWTEPRAKAPNGVLLMVNADLTLAQRVAAVPNMLDALHKTRDLLRGLWPISGAHQESIGPVLDAVEQAIRLAEHGEAM